MSFKEYPALILKHFALLYYVCKIFGVVPHSFSEFQRFKRLKNSNIGIIITVGIVIVLFAVSHFLIMLMNSSPAEGSNALTTVIGLVLNYISPIMMAVDLFAWVYNRQKIIDLFEEFNLMDVNLFKQGITANNDEMRRRISILIGFTFVSEITITCLTYYLFDSLSLLYIISFFPTFLSALDKIWFSSLLMALKARFSALNCYIDQTVDEYNRSRKIREKFEGLNAEGKTFGYLHKEILTRNIAFSGSKVYPASEKAFTLISSKDHAKSEKNIIPVIPWNDRISSEDPKTRKSKFTILQSKENILNNLEHLEDKLNNLCRLHDEMCEMGKTINGMWSVQMLLLMAYGFMSITAQFYFLYCSMTDQNVPELFISSKSLVLSCIFVVYVAMKCVCVIFLSWQTKLESRRTGVCVHKCALAVDDNNIYEIVNHISLKLMNHAVDFSACGFFNLDMTTLYAVTGAITSYLIILIQFNLAGRAGQAKPTVDPASTSTVSSVYANSSLMTSLKPTGMDLLLGTTTLKPRT